MSETIAALQLAVEAAPTDSLPKLVLADALDEAGEVAKARTIRLTVALRDRGVPAGEIWTLERAAAEKGHAARTAEQILRGGKVLVVIYTDESLTASGLLAVKTSRQTEVIHYRKSSGGRWGRSVARTYLSI